MSFFIQPSPFQLFFQSNSPIGVPSSGSVANDGAVTFTTAMSEIQLPGTGAWLFFAANVLFAGSLAGFYFCLMQSGATAVAYGNFYQGTSQVPSIPAAAGLISLSGKIGPGAFVQDTTNKGIMLLPIPGGVIGVNGILRADMRFAMSNNANSKTALFGMPSATLSPNIASFKNHSSLFEYRNLGSNQYQISNVTPGTPYGGLTVNQTEKNLDLTASQNFSIFLGHSIDTDYVLMIGIDMKIQNP